MLNVRTAHNSNGTHQEILMLAVVSYNLDSKAQPAKKINCKSLIIQISFEMANHNQEMVADNFLFSDFDIGYAHRHHYLLGSFVSHQLEANPSLTKCLAIH
jgi:hypothetical protein